MHNTPPAAGSLGNPRGRGAATDQWPLEPLPVLPEPAPVPLPVPEPVPVVGGLPLPEGLSAPGVVGAPLPFIELPGVSLDVVPLPEVPSLDVLSLLGSPVKPLFASFGAFAGLS